MYCTLVVVNKYKIMFCGFVSPLLLSFVIMCSVVLINTQNTQRIYHKFYLYDAGNIIFFYVISSSSRSQF